MDKSAVLQSMAGLYFCCLTKKHRMPKCCFTTPMAARQRPKASSDLTLPPALRGGGHTCERSVREKRARGKEFGLSRKEEGRGKCAAREPCMGESGVHVRRGVREGVNKVRRAVARTTTNPELGLEPSQCPTHPSFAPSVFFPASLRRTA